MKIIRIIEEKLGITYKIGEEIREGWREPVMIYRFKCLTHGYVENYLKGYNSRLECPECARELRLTASKLNTNRLG